MLRLLHTADVHLGARHTDLGERAAALRERQFAAFRTSVELAIVEKVDIFLVAGDLFDSNTQPRRSVERVAAELGRLARASIRTVIIPGTHDVYDGASIYRSYDLAGMARAASDWVVVLTPSVDRGRLPVTRRDRLRSRLRYQALAAKPAGRPRRQLGHASHVEDRHGPRRARDPGAHRFGRRRRHRRGDRQVGPGLPGAGPLALRDRGPSRKRVVRLFRRA